MYTLLFFTISIFLLVGFLLMKKIFQKKEIFLLHSIEQLRLEKRVWETNQKELESLLQQTEKELLEIRKSNLYLRQISERTQEENLALRNLLEALQKSRESKNDDVIVEYFIKS